MSVDSTPRLINSGKPFRNMAIKYHEAGWYPLPLPPRQKEMPPTGYTGHNKNKYMSVDKAEQITAWLEHHPKDANIGMWLHDGVVGLDVDAYFKGEKQYEGQLTFAEMEKKLGALPPTWTSTARSDKVSGIRFFQVPKGLVFPGKAGPGIDIIFSGYRYTVVYPSSHREGGQYQWYRPGMDLDGAPARWTREAVEHPDSEWKHTFARIEAFGEYPHPDDLTYLPEAWVEALTLGKKTDRPMDVAATIPDLDKWVVDNFQNTTLAKPEWCSMLEKTYLKHVKAVRDNADSHQYLINAHWSLVNLGLEGHQGWGTAMRRFDKFFTREMLHRGKRLPNELRGEIFRSKYNAIRLIKGKVDMAAEESGISLFTPRCACYTAPEVTEDPSQPGLTPKKPEQSPSEYELNDDGNGAFLHDLYPKNLIWVPGHGQWMLWTGDRWQRDPNGFLARRCWQKVKDQQQNYTDHLWSHARGLDPETPEAKEARKKAADFEKHSIRSGNNLTAKNALEAATVIDGASIEAEQLDDDIHLLGVQNGLLELTEEGAKFRKAEYNDYVTYNTGIEYLEPVDLVKSGGDIAKGRILWSEYLDLFVPDKELRHFVQKVMGYCMLGRNTEKLAIFLKGLPGTGKSTMLNVVMRALGEYAGTANLQTLFADSKLNPALAQALPKRILTASEAGAGTEMSVEVFKRLTGNDPTSAELKGVNVVVTRIPAFTIVIATNHPPAVPGADKGLMRRLCIIPFNEAVDEAHDKKGAADQLEALAPEAVLTWLVEGWRMYAKEGLDRSTWPTVVNEETKEFGSRLNDIGEFVADAVEHEKGARTGLGEMYQAYIRWADEQKIQDTKRHTKNKFGREMRIAGYDTTNPIMVNGVKDKYWMNIKPKEGKFKFKSEVS